MAVDEIEERLADVNKSFTKPLLVGNIPGALRQKFPGAKLIEDTERLDFNPGAHDLVVHGFGLHWADDPVGQMVQSRLALEPDGLFLGVLFAGQTLSELRIALAEAETTYFGGISPRVAPLADVRTLGDLLVRAGMALPVADTLRIEREYASLRELARELRRLGETNALFGRRSTVTPRGYWDLAQKVYRESFPGKGSNEAIMATFELVFLTGWAPDNSQPKPLRPGSASTRLADALGVPELQTGDTADPTKR